MKKILILLPPSPYLLIQKWDLPINLFYLTGFMRKNNFDITFKNLAGLDNYLDEIPFDYDIYGVSLFTPQHDIAIEIGNHIKKNTDALLIAGGHHVTYVPDEFLSNSKFDAVVRGEGEFTLLDICKGKPFEDIEGLSYKFNGEIIHNPDRPFHKNIDEIPYPRFDDIDLNEYASVSIDQPHSKYSIDIMTSRGCPQKCAFCASCNFWKKKVRFQSAEYVIDYIDFLYNQGIKDFTFVDDNFLLKYDRLEKICNKLKSIDCKWACCSRSDSINERVAKLMSDAGCEKIALGVETASNKLLDHVNKNTTVEEHKNAVSILKEHDLTILCYIMVGLPGEDEEDIQATCDFLRYEPIDYYTISTFVPYPGTPLWENPEQYGISIDRDRPYSDYCSLSKDLNIKSVCDNIEQTNKHREMLIKAAPEKCTNLKSFKIAESLEK